MKKYGIGAVIGAIILGFGLQYLLCPAITGGVAIIIVSFAGWIVKLFE